MPDDVGPYRGTFQQLGHFEAASDGTVWLDLVGPPRAEGNACRGIADVDGTTWRRYLGDHCIYALSVGPDGRAWVQAGDDRWLLNPGPIQTYVITPDNPSS